ncbi:MAG: RNA methyltransferase [Balneolaceae bacterium]|nr:MAG: RNA methyltransferase [Balneolaceae bacterium]
MNSKPASKNHIKNRKKLLMGKYRKKEQLFLAEGSRCVEQILENGAIEVIELLIEDGFDAVSLNPACLPVYSLNSDDFNSLSDTETPQGVIAVCRIPPETDLRYLAEQGGLLVAFDEIQDPGNLGTMIRTASWFESAGLLIGEGTVDMFHPKVVRSTAGATGTIPYLKGDLFELLGNLEKSGCRVFLLDASDDSVELRSVNPEKDKKTVLVVGNEASGVQSKLFGNNRIAVKIEGKSNRVESLNAAVALSIGLYHFQN